MDRPGVRGFSRATMRRYWRFKSMKFSLAAVAAIAAFAFAETNAEPQS